MMMVVAVVVVEEQEESFFCRNGTGMFLLLVVATYSTTGEEIAYSNKQFSRKVLCSMLTLCLLAGWFLRFFMFQTSGQAFYKEKSLLQKRRKKSFSLFDPFSHLCRSLLLLPSPFFFFGKWTKDIKTTRFPLRRAREDWEREEEETLLGLLLLILDVGRHKWTFRVLPLATMHTLPCLKERFRLKSSCNRQDAHVFMCYVLVLYISACPCMPDTLRKYQPTESTRRNFFMQRLPSNIVHNSHGSEGERKPLYCSVVTCL